MAWENQSRTWTCILAIFQFCCLNSALGLWAPWGEWSEGPCSVTCGGGNMVVRRIRICATPDVGCSGLNYEKKTIACTSDKNCGDLQCYECNVFRSGKREECEDNKVVDKCSVCMKSYTRISMQYRMGDTIDSIVESRQCVQHHDYTAKAEEGCVYHRNNGGVSIVCHCLSDRCNTGLRPGPALTLFLISTMAWIF